MNGIARAPHPWVFIEEEMAARGWGKDDVANRMGFNTIEEWQMDRLALDMMEALREPHLRFGETIIGKLSMAFGVSREFFANAEAAWLSRPDLEEVCAMWRAEIAAGLEPQKHPTCPAH